MSTAVVVADPSLTLRDGDLTLGPAHHQEYFTRAAIIL
jgi:hypothetical protein